MNAAASTRAVAKPVMGHRECMRRHHRKLIGEKKAGRSPLEVSTGCSTVRLYCSVDDLYPVATVPGGLRGLGERPSAAVVVAHDDLVLLFRLHRFLDFVSAEGAAERTEDGGDVLAASAADLVAEDAADDRAADRAHAGALSGLLHRANVLDDRALAADRRDHCRRGRRGRRRNNCFLRSLTRL